MTHTDSTHAVTGPVLVIGATGKTGSRVAARLHERGLEVREGSRAASPPFDWERPGGWKAALEGVEAAYVTYYPDLAAPGSTRDISLLTELAAASGLRRMVLLSGRGEAEAQRCEEVVRAAPFETTIVRASWFAQNFSESFFRDPVAAGVLALPADGVAEPFVDAEDIADVAVEALTGEGHDGEVYEVTGPRLLTFGDVAAEISAASGRDVAYVPITVDEFAAGLAAEGVPADVADLLRYLFTEVLDGRNASLAAGVQRALGREPRDFAEFAREAAAGGVWNM